MKRLRYIFTTMISLLLLAACTPVQVPTSETTTESNEVVTEDCRVITHDMGETEVCGTPTTIIALGPHMLDILISLGVPAAGFAETQYINEEDWGKPVGNIVYLGPYIETMPINVGDRQDPNLEVILSLQPDLILSELRDQAQLDLLQQIAPTLAYRGNRADDWQRTIVPIAEALNIPAEAERVMAEHEAYMAEKRAELEPIIAQYPKISFISQNQESVLSTFTDESWAGDLLADLGFEVVAYPGEAGAATDISSENMPELETDTIVLGASGSATPELAKELWSGNAVLAGHPASIANRVYFVDYQLWSRLRGPISARLVVEDLISYLTAE